MRDWSLNEFEIESMNEIESINLDILTIGLVWMLNCEYLVDRPSAKDNVS